MKIKINQGFTLIEMLIVVAIMGILGTVAMSMYGDYVIAAKRTDARTGLQETATMLDKCKSTYGSYNSANCSISDGDTRASTRGLYDIVVTSAASTFSLTASPSAGSTQIGDTKCTSLTLNNLGKQTGTGTAPDECW